MSSTNGTVIDNDEYSGKRHSHHRSSFRAGGRGPCCGKGNWSGFNIAAMVLGFVLFWPVGLVILYWNISGRDLKDLPTAAKQLWNKVSNGMCCNKEGLGGVEETDNAVFNEYQQTQYDRIREIKEEIKHQARRFNVFRSEAKRRADEEEFREFMSKNRDA